MFRGGNIQDLGKLLEATAKALEKRVNNVSFTAAEKKSSEGNVEAGCKVFLDHSIRSLCDIANDMKKSKEEEPDDYHWLVIADFIEIIDGLLKKMGR